MLTAVSSGLTAALRLARGRADGATLVADDAGATASSFWAILFCVPSVIARVLIAWIGEAPPTDAGHQIALELITFVLGWLVFVELTHLFARVTGVMPRWRRFIIVWNWCNVIEGVLVILGIVPGLLGAPLLVDETCQVITIGWALWLEWYAARVALGITGPAAVGLVIMDQAIGIILGTIALMLPR